MLIHAHTTGITAVVFRQFRFRENLPANVTKHVAEVLMKQETALQKIPAKVQRNLSVFPVRLQTAYITKIKNVPQTI